MSKDRELLKDIQAHRMLCQQEPTLDANEHQRRLDVAQSLNARIDARLAEPEYVGFCNAPDCDTLHPVCQDASPYTAEPQGDAGSRDIERAFQMLEMYGVPRERAKNVANGIQVLVTRMDREIAALRAEGGGRGVRGRWESNGKAVP